MLQTQTADDYVIATGTSYSLEQFVEKSFEPYGLDWKKYVQVDKSFFRPLDIHISRRDPTKAENKLAWSKHITIDEVIQRMTRPYFD
jgi:GDPmannose 4,6-dehydratase